MKQLISRATDRLSGLLQSGPADVAIARQRELEFHREWQAAGGGVSDEEWRRQNHALFLAFSDDQAHESRLIELGIDAFIQQATDGAADEFDRLWGRPLAGKNVIDVGCGSRVRTGVFDRSSITCLEPLLDEYRRLNSAAFELPNIAATYSEPAEVRIKALIDTQDLSLCWNVLDHCSDWKRVLINIADYLRQGGRLIMGTDCDVSDEIHASISGGGPTIVAFCKRRGLRLDYELPGPSLSRDWAGVFVKQ